MGTSLLALYQGACLLIKQKPVASLAENSIIRQTLDTVYPSVFAWMMAAGEWHAFARAISLTPDTTDQPSFGYNYFFTKPTDYVRIIRISASPYMYPTLEDFQEEGQTWVANCNPLFLQYVSNDNTHGNNLGVWGSHFELAFQHELAVRIAPHVTRMGVTDFADLKKDRNQALRDARSKDAINLAAERPPPGLLTQSRLGRRAYYGPGWDGPGTW